MTHPSRAPVYLTSDFATPSPLAHPLPKDFTLPSPASELSFHGGLGSTRRPAGWEGQTATDPTARTRPYKPASQVTQTELDMKSARSNWQNFHTPWNTHNRFLVAATHANRVAYRDLERSPPPPFGNPGRRPTSAPPGRGRRPTGIYYTQEEAQRLAAGMQGLAAGAFAGSLHTGTGAPSFAVPAVVEVDIEEGALLRDGDAEAAATRGEGWRATRVQAYAVPPHPLGFGPGAAKPFHADYRHYKYMGFAGKGAKTSWGHNPKYSLINSYAGKSTRAVARSPAREVQTRYLQPAELIDPHLELVDMDTRRRLAAQQPAATPDQLAEAEENWGALPSGSARVLTYRVPAQSGYALAENPSPNMGSQSPFYSRYTHYKYFGFAGKGATSSWARNPKAALL